MCYCDSIVLLGILFLLYTSGFISLTQLLLLLALLSTTGTVTNNTTTANA